jgi:hypothetical protein
VIVAGRNPEKVRAADSELSRGLASLINALNGNPIHGTTIDQASTQR